MVAVFAMLDEEIHELRLGACSPYRARRRHRNDVRVDVTRKEFPRPRRGRRCWRRHRVFVHVELPELFELTRELGDAQSSRKTRTTWATDN